EKWQPDTARDPAFTRDRRRPCNQWFSRHGGGESLILRPAIFCMAAVELILTNEPEDRKRLHGALEEFAAEHSISAKALREADLALEEYLTNVFTHGFEQRGAHAVVIRMAVDAPWL